MVSNELCESIHCYSVDELVWCGIQKFVDNFPSFQAYDSCVNVHGALNHKCRPSTLIML